MLKNQEFRIDSSNTDTKYLRNNIRKHIIPLIKDINSDKSLDLLNSYFSYSFDLNDESIEIISTKNDNKITDFENVSVVSTEFDKMVKKI